MPDVPVKADQISKSFSRRAVIDGLSMQISAGSVFGLVGLNGAGKTTLIRLLLGLLHTEAGVVMLLGQDPWKHEPSLYRQLGVVLESDGFAGNLAFRENLNLFGKAKGLDVGMVSQYVSEFWTGTDVVDTVKKVKLLSRGQRVQCGLCRAFLGWPRVLLLDEPTVALDVKAYEHFCGLVRQARARGAAVLISSHQLSAIEELCDQVGLLQNGKVSVLDTSRMGRTYWIINADHAAGDEGLLKPHVTGEPQYRDGAWRIRVASPDQDIPRIVTALAAAGRSIREVRPEEEDLRTMVRRMYE
jgi:ABC-2 type transport system ATP-binding protein